MKKWLCIIVLAGFAACQKGVEPFTDSGTGSGGAGTSASIVGTWNFISVSANTQSSNEDKDMDSVFKTITLSNYTTTDSSGNVTFNADGTYSSSGIGYSVSTIAHGYNYKNGIFQDSVSVPFSFSIDSSNTSSAGTYKLIGTDSIYFSQPLVSTSVATSAQPEPGGGKISFNGNRLFLNENFYLDTTLEIGDLPVHKIDSGKFVITFQKQ